MKEAPKRRNVTLVKPKKETCVDGMFNSPRDTSTYADVAELDKIKGPGEKLLCLVIRTILPETKVRSKSNRDDDYAPIVNTMATCQEVYKFAFPKFVIQANFDVHVSHLEDRLPPLGKLEYRKCIQNLAIDLAMFDDRVKEVPEIWVRSILPNLKKLTLKEPVTTSFLQLASHDHINPATNLPNEAGAAYLGSPDVMNGALCERNERNETNEDPFNDHRFASIARRMKTSP